MNEFKIGLHIAVISSITQAEISKAPDAVQNILLNMMDYDCEILLETEESMALANKDLKEKIVSRNFEDDARHIAVGAFLCVRFRSNQQQSEDLFLFVLFGLTLLKRRN